MPDRRQLETAVQLAALDLYAQAGSEAYFIELPHPAGGVMLFMCGPEDELQRVLEERSLERRRSDR